MEEGFIFYLFDISLDHKVNLDVSCAIIQNAFIFFSITYRVKHKEAQRKGKYPWIELEFISGRAMPYQFNLGDL